MGYFRKNIDLMAGYQPGEQPGPGEKFVKLNTNENPYPPSPRAMEALRSLDADLLRRYPDPMATRFRQVVSDVLGLPLDWIIAGNGSDDLLTMVCRSLTGENDTVSFAIPTYVLYETLAQIQGALVMAVPFNAAYTLPVEELLEARANITFVANPNSPSGTQASMDELRQLAERAAGVVVIDEAYADFAAGNCLELVRELPNVIVLRTLSKSYSLAGLRLGFAVACPPLIEGLRKVKDSYNVDAAACAVGAAAFADQVWMKDNARKIVAGRAQLSDELRRRGFDVWPSQSNFVLARVPGGQGKAAYEALKARGVLVRYFHQDQLYDKLRITVGTDEQNRALLTAIDDAGLGQPA